MTRRTLTILIALGLTIAAFALAQIAVRSLPAPQLDSPIGHSVKLIANIAQTLCLPAWLAIAVVLGMPAAASAPGIAASSALGVAGWAAAVWSALAIRRTMLRPTRAPATPPSTVPAPTTLRPALGTPHLSRRALLVNAPFAVLTLGGCGSLGRATLVDPWWLEIRPYDIEIADLPPQLDGLRIAHISDTHLGPRIPAAFLRDAIARAVALKPDLALLTGDYINSGRRFIRPAAAVFEPLVSACPAVAVLGNHDWYGDAPAMRSALQSSGVTVIDNDRVFLDAASRAVVPHHHARHALCLAGVGDLVEDTIDLRRALRDVPPDMPRLLLAHNPDTAEHHDITGHRAPHAAPRIDLMLSGHTHGGQVRLPIIGTPIIPSDYGQKYAGGLVRGPACPVLVSRGIGMSLLPVRLGVPPEIPIITLHRRA